MRTVVGMLLLVLAVLGTLLVTVRGSEDDDLGVTVVRVSGTKGVAYSGEYGTTGEMRTAEGTLGAEPTNYEVPTEYEFFDVAPDPVYALFWKTKPGGGNLMVVVVDGGEPVAQDESSDEFGTVSVNWDPLSGDKGGSSDP